MQTYASVVSIIYISLAAFAVVAIDLRIVLIPTACASLLLFAAGLIAFRRWRAAISIRWPVSVGDTESTGTVVIEGTACPFQGYEQELIVIVQPRHSVELLACVTLAGITFYLMIFGQIDINNPAGLRIGAFQAEFICGVGLAVLIANLRWFVERLFLRRSRYSIGTMLGRDPGFFHRGITYQFRDDKGERRGGRGPLWGSERDNAALILYDPSNPDSNTVHGAFLFHKFSIGLIPARQR